MQSVFGLSTVVQLLPRQYSSLYRLCGPTVFNNLHSSLPRRAVWGSTIASVSAAFSGIYSLPFETGTLHIGGFGPCQTTLLLLQVHEPGAITCGESGEFKRTLYWEKHSIERETVPEKPANTGMPAIFLRLYNAWLSKSSRATPWESLGSQYVRDQPDTDIKCKGLDTKATVGSTELMYSPKVRVRVRNKGRNASFCCQSGLQSRQPSHSSLAQLLTEIPPGLLDLCLTCLTPQYFSIFQFPLWWKKAVLFLPWTWNMTSNYCLGQWGLDLRNYFCFSRL